MSMEPPTEKQVAYLKKKGKTVPATKKEASELISSLIPNSNNGSFQKKEINVNALTVEAEQKADIEGFVDGCVPRLIIALARTKKICETAGITENPAIGMIFNQVCEQRRFER